MTDAGSGLFPTARYSDHESALSRKRTLGQFYQECDFVLPERERRLGKFPGTVVTFSINILNWLNPEVAYRELSVYRGI